ncbi:MAG: DUF1501 domain-containing protein [Acidobacteria bacterium]|nr:DUF1501 domain-containing protein [Acidobacteriota bacterium]
MKTKQTISRRHFLQMSASCGVSLGMLAALGQLRTAQAQTAQNYKALVCLFLLGGNDGHNLVVPTSAAQYNAYTTARGGLALPPAQILGISDPVQGAFGLHYAMPEMQTLYQQGHLAIVANVGVLARPTTYHDYQTANQLPTNLRSHSDQVVQMQTGFPNASGATGWGGRAVDVLQSLNTGTAFPVSISMNGNAQFCAGALVQGANLQPGNYLSQNAMSLWPASAGQARATAQQQIVTLSGSNQMVNAANKTMADALQLGPLLQAAAGNPAFTTMFPNTAIGNQLKEIARFISLRSQTGAGRQVFFCGLGGFDTHSGQSYQQWFLLQQVSQALAAFYNATAEMGVANQVTAFTLSDFGRTLQPSGSGSDHGWGNHHLLVGGAVNGGRMYGTFPLMTNYANFNATHEDYADNRGTMLPGVSLAQYGATLAKWFGASDAQLDGLFPILPGFAVRDVGFLA